MAGPNLKQQLRRFIRYKHDQGILDHHFQDVRGLQSPENPRFVSEMITTFINDADVAMATVTRLLMNNNIEVLNFDNLFNIVHPLKGSSASIGGCRMAPVCHELCLACNERNKERFIEMFERLKPEYRSLRESLDYIRQLEDSMYEARRHLP